MRWREGLPSEPKNVQGRSRTVLGGAKSHCVQSRCTQRRDPERDSPVGIADKIKFELR